MIDPAKADKFARRVMLARARMVGTMLVNEIREMISIPSRTVTYKETRSGKFRKVLGPRGSNRSTPGNPPHKDTGALRASITYTIEEAGGGFRVVVGSPLAYSLFLEKGTRKMAARPFLRRALKENHERIRQLSEHGQLSDIKVSE